MDIRDEINKRKKENWFEVLFAIEALGVTEEVVVDSLKKHVEKLSHVKDVFVYDRQFTYAQNVKNPLQNVPEAYSQVVNVKFFVKDIATLINVVLTYGPSSVEILGPNKKEVSASELQNVANGLAGVVHMFAAAGIGGIVITPDEK